LSSKHTGYHDGNDMIESSRATYRRDVFSGKRVGGVRDQHAPVYSKESNDDDDDDEQESW